MLCLGVQGASAANLVTNGNFAAGSSSWSTTNSATVKSIDWSTKCSKATCPVQNWACLPLSKGGFVQQALPAALKTNTRYQVKFKAFREVSGEANNVSALGDLRFSIRQANDAGTVTGNRIYKEDSIKVPVASSGATPSLPQFAFFDNWSFSYNFVTPARDVDNAVNKNATTGVLFATKPNVFFYAKPEGGPTNGSICITNVELNEVIPVATNAPAVRYNQAGYGLTGKHEVTLANFKPGYYTYQLVGKTRASSYQANVTFGSVVVPTNLPVDADSGDTIFKLDFADDATALENEEEPWNLPGAVGLLPYQYNGDNLVFNISSSANAFSVPIRLARNVYTPLKRDALHFFYAQRAGQAVTDNRYPAYRNFLTRAAGHSSELAGCFSGIDLHGVTWPGCNFVSGDPRVKADTNDGNKLKLDVTGGWYDAGDQGKYVVNAGISLWTLQNTIERLQKKGTLSTSFPDGVLLYPGTANGRSDLLDEARYEMEFLLNMQVPGNLTMQVPVGQQGKTIYSAGNGYGIDKSTPYLLAGRYSTDPTGHNYKQVLKLSDTDVTGMVFSAVRDAKWTKVPFAPASDTPAVNKRVLDHPTTAATLSLAATAAQCARIWKDVDSTFAARCANAATIAWAAAIKNPSIYRYGEYTLTPYAGGNTSFSEEMYGYYLPAVVDGGGAYADGRVSDEFYWAGIEMYLANAKTDGTADTATTNAYLTTAISYANSGECDSQKYFSVQCYSWVNTMSWNSVAPLGSISAITARPDKFSGTIAAPINTVTLPSGSSTVSPRKNLLTLANKLVSQISTSGYSVPHTGSYDWGSNADVLNAAIILGVAYDISGDVKYANGVGNAMNYILGNNPQGKSYVTGYGANAVDNMHHRFWGKHASASFPSAPPGIVVGGPNGQNLAAIVGAGHNPDGSFNTSVDNEGAITYLEKTIPGCTVAGKIISMRCYTDDFRVFQTNEVALNWNAPLFWAATFMDEYLNR